MDPIPNPNLNHDGEAALAAASSARPSNHHDTPASPPDEAEIAERAQALDRLVESVGRVVVGQQRMVRQLVLGLLTGGHVLLEGVPGLAKTLTVSSLAKGLHGEFSRIQFTPDLLPADLVGTLIYNPNTAEFTPRKGPVFANIVLADEINRAPAKVQSALLEAMQEKSVTIGDTTHTLPKPFLVLATQNPIEQEGTYPLPEAQVDRFMLKLRVGYPTPAEERDIVARMASTKPPLDIEPVVSLDDIQRARELVDRVHVDPKIFDYVVNIVNATRAPAARNEGVREHDRRQKRKNKSRTDDATKLTKELARFIEFGASPRASIALTLAGKANAFLSGRGFVTPSDVKEIALDVLRHRVILSYEAEAEGIDADEVVGRVLDAVPVP